MSDETIPPVDLTEHYSAEYLNDRRELVSKMKPPVKDRIEISTFIDPSDGGEKTTASVFHLGQLSVETIVEWANKEGVSDKEQIMVSVGALRRYVNGR